MILSHIFIHTLFFTLVANGFLLVMMITLSPRVWGYSDYSQEIKDKIPPQTKKEKTLATIVGVPWMLFTFGFPLFSAYALKAKLDGVIPFWLAFVHILILILFATLGDLVVLDWFVVSKLTPKFVIMPGTTKADYKDFSHHFREHARAALFELGLCLIYAGIVYFV